jgi:hypothetical protein
MDTVSAGGLGDIAEHWLERLFGPRLHRLPAPRDERWGVLVLGPLDIAMGFRRAARGPVAFDLLHGPFDAFTYDAAPEGDRLRETLAFTVPGWYGGPFAARWFARYVLAGFREAQP